MCRTIVLLPMVIACGTSKPAKAPDGGAGDLASAGDMAVRPGSMPFHYVMDAITLPTSSADYAMDLIGDGVARNQFGKICKTLLSYNTNLQAQENTTIGKGDGLNLLTLSTTDPKQQNDTAPTLTAYIAMNQEPPDFSGGGQFTVDTTIPKGVIGGVLQVGNFQSNDPNQQTSPGSIWVRLSLYQDTSVVLPLVGARVRYALQSDTMSISGQINGGIAKADIDRILLPALTKTLNNLASMSMCNAQCMQVRALFDSNGDNMVELDEVKNSPLVMSLLKPDVQLFDAAGNWHPSSANTSPDSISLGVLFDAVTARFTDPM